MFQICTWWLFPLNSLYIVKQRNARRHFKGHVVSDKCHLLTVSPVTKSSFCTAFMFTHKATWGIWPSSRWSLRKERNCSTPLRWKKKERWQEGRTDREGGRWWGWKFWPAGVQWIGGSLSLCLWECVWESVGGTSPKPLPPLRLYKCTFSHEHKMFMQYTYSLYSHVIHVFCVHEWVLT